MIRVEYATILSVVCICLLGTYCNSIIDELYAENEQLQQRVWELEEQNGFQHFKVTVTMYNPTRKQCDSTPNITADGTKINPKKASSYRYVALSRDLLSRWGGPFDYGDYVVIEGTDKHDGVYQVRDTMNPKWVKRVDILRTPGSKRFKYNNITLTKYGTEDNDNFAWRN